MDKETKKTLGRLAEWFGMMGFAESSDAMAAECLEHGDEVYFSENPHDHLRWAAK